MNNDDSQRNAQQVANSISSAASHISRENENRAHERHMHEIKMGMANATSDRQYRALEILLQEEKERWEKVLAKRKRNIVVGIIGALIMFPAIIIFTFYMIGKSSNSYETVHNDVGVKQTNPIEKSVTHSSGTELENQQNATNVEKETVSSEVDTTKLSEVQAIAWVTSIVAEEQYCKGIMSEERSYIYESNLKENSLLYINQYDDEHRITNQYRINNLGQLERNTKTSYETEESFELISENYLDISLVQEYITKFDKSLIRFNPYNIVTLEDAVSYIVQSLGQNYSINNAETYQDDDNFYVSLDIPPSQGRAAIQKSYKVYSDGSIDKKVGATYISVLKRNH